MSLIYKSNQPPVEVSDNRVSRLLGIGGDITPIEVKTDNIATYVDNISSDRTDWLKSDVPTVDAIKKYIDEVGTEGPQGNRGYQGLQGTPGDRGYQGYQGYQGSQGPIGPTGPQGSPGSNGSQGPIGPTGPQGSPGSNGSNGSQGPRGYQGYKGSFDNSQASEDGSNSLIAKRNSSYQLYAAGGFFEESDERLKTILKPLSVARAIEIIKGVPGVLYTLNSDETSRHRLGVIAQDLLKVAPELVVKDDKGYYSVNYDKLSVVCMVVISYLLDHIFRNN